MLMFHCWPLCQQRKTNQLMSCWGKKNVEDGILEVPVELANEDLIVGGNDDDEEEEEEKRKMMMILSQIFLSR